MVFVVPVSVQPKLKVNWKLPSNHTLAIEA